MSVYKLTGNLLALQEQAGEIDTTVFNDTADSIKLELNDDYEACGHVIDNIQSDVDGIKIAINQLQARKHAMINNQDKLREMVALSIRATGNRTVKTKSYTFTAPDKNKIVLNKYDRKTIPVTYFDMKPQPNDSRIKADLLAGKVVGDATVTKVPSLTIRH